MRNIVRAAVAAVVIAAGAAGGAGAAAAQPDSHTGALARPCHLSVDDGGQAWWRGCSFAGDKVRITYTNRGPATICVELNQERFIGKMPVPVTSAKRIGSCP